MTTFLKGSELKLTADLCERREQCLCAQEMETAPLPLPGAAAAVSWLAYLLPGYPPPP